MNHSSETLPVALSSYSFSYIRATPPFHRLHIDLLKARADSCLTASTARKLARDVNKIDFRKAVNSEVTPAEKRMLDFTKILTKMSLFWPGLQKFRQKILELAERCNDDLYAGSPADYALAYTECGGDQEQALNDVLATFSGAAVRYAPLAEPTRIVRRMYFSNAAAMLRADFFEGLMVGHAPKKCRICGKWFLTTDAHRAAYCDGYAPDDPGGRTCRQIGAKLGREEREKADNHPVRKVYQHTINAINQRLHRGTITEETAVAARKLAKEHMERAVTDHTFAANEYKQRMKVDTLLSEATP